MHIKLINIAGQLYTSMSKYKIRAKYIQHPHTLETNRGENEELSLLVAQLKYSD